jgi:hypothetical protein
MVGAILDEQNLHTHPPFNDGTFISKSSPRNQRYQTSSHGDFGKCHAG